MRFYRDRPDVLTDVTWYFVPEGTPWIGVPNVFNSRNWYLNTPSPWPQLGEVEGAPRPWSNGHAPAALAQARCGSSDRAWSDGVSFDQADTVPHTDSGILICCLRGPFMPEVMSVRCDDGSLDVAPSFGDVECHLNVANSNVWTGSQFFIVNGLTFSHWISSDPAFAPPLDPEILAGIDGSTTPGQTLLAYYGDRGAGPMLNGRIFADGRNWYFGSFRISMDHGQPDAGLNVRQLGNQAAVLVTPNGSLVSAGPQFRAETFANVGLFQIGHAGEIGTNQVEAPAGIGTVIGRFPVYDAEGVFLGYVPVYDSV